MGGHGLVHEGYHLIEVEPVRPEDSGIDVHVPGCLLDAVLDGAPVGVPVAARVLDKDQVQSLAGGEFHSGSGGGCCLLWCGARAGGGFYAFALRLGGWGTGGRFQALSSHWRCVGCFGLWGGGLYRLYWLVGGATGSQQDGHDGQYNHKAC